MVNNLVQIRPFPHYAGGIWKRSFIYTVRPTVHTNPSRKRSFSKTLFKPEEFENAGFARRENILKTKVFENDLCCVLNSSGIVDGKHLMRFKSETSIFKHPLCHVPQPKELDYCNERIRHTRIKSRSPPCCFNNQLPSLHYALKCIMYDAPKCILQTLHPFLFRYNHYDFREMSTQLKVN